MKCIKGYEVEPQRSGAGYYMGTTTEIGEPKCRLTTQYTNNREDAKNLPLDRQDASENAFCNGFGKCFKN